MDFQQILMGAATAPSGGVAAAQSYWGLSFATTGGVRDVWVAGDAAGNVGFSARATDAVNSGSPTGLMAFITSAGAVSWQDILYTGFSFNRGCSFDSPGNLYAGGTFFPGANQSAFVAKRNASGVLQWQRSLTPIGTDNAPPSGFWANTSGTSVFLIAYTQSVGAGFAVIVCYDATGALQWQRKLSAGAVTVTAVNNPFIDSAGNVYVCGSLPLVGLNAIWVAKYNSSGTLQWQRTLVGASGSTQGQGVTSDTNGNVIVVGNTTSQGAGSTDAIIASYNSSGAIQWQRTLGNSLVNTARGVITDASNNIYLVGSDAVSSKTQLLLAKYDSSGVLQWQNNILTTNGCASTIVGVGLDNNSNLLVGGYDQGAGAAQKGYAWKLPNDGSRTGAYGIFTYSAAALTDAASTLIDAAGALVDAAGPMTDAAGSLTDATSSYTTALQAM